MALTFIALLLSSAISNIFTISTLWTIAGDGMQMIVQPLAWVFSGILVPLAFFPDGMQQLLRLLPSSGIIDIPIRLYTGMIPVSDLLALGLLQLAWTGIFIIIGLHLLARAMKRVVVQGG